MTGSGISHSVCGIPREAEPRMNSRTESFNMIACTPPPDFAWCASSDLRMVTVLFSTGRNESRFERYRERAFWRSARLILAAGLYSSPAAYSSILCWIKGEERITPRKTRLTCQCGSYSGNMPAHQQWSLYLLKSQNVQNRHTFQYLS